MLIQQADQECVSPNDLGLREVALYDGSAATRAERRGSARGSFRRRAISTNRSAERWRRRRPCAPDWPRSARAAWSASACRLPRRPHGGDDPADAFLLPALGGKRSIGQRNDAGHLEAIPASEIAAALAGLNDRQRRRGAPMGARDGGEGIQLTVLRLAVGRIDDRHLGVAEVRLEIFSGDDDADTAGRDAVDDLQRAQGAVVDEGGHALDLRCGEGTARIRCAVMVRASATL